MAPKTQAARWRDARPPFYPSDPSRLAHTHQCRPCQTGPTAPFARTAAADLAPQVPQEKTFDTTADCENLARNCHYLMIKRFVILSLSMACGFSTFTSAAAEKSKPNIDVSKLPPASSRKDVTFATDIKPIFEKSCFGCHGPEKAKGKLRLDSLSAALKGGEDGKVVEPGHSADSVLVQNVAHLGEPDDFMPPPKNKGNIPPLTPEQIGLIRAWIDSGAK
jgi:mono/diheme cytochrome c family protein